MPKPAPKIRRKLSREGLLLIKSFEGFRPRAVARRDGVLTIGYGHTQSAREGIEITEAEAELLLLHDLLPAVNLLNTQLRRQLSQNQFDALVSFIYSIGTERFEKSDILDLIRKNKMADAAEAIACIPDRKQPPIDMPYRRRCAERAMFEMQDTPTLEKILTAPVSRPGTYVAPPEDAPLGTTGVLRHETLNLAPHWSTPCRRTLRANKDLGTVVLLAAVGVIMAISALIGFQRGLSLPLVQSHGLTIASSLGVMGLCLLLGSIWLFTRTARPRPHNIGAL